MNRTISYAQNREDLLLSGFFAPEEDGFYVDVGANNPTADSVTKLFYDRGWHGINIEPLKTQFEQLQRERPRDVNLNIGISNKAGTLNLREYGGDGLSTFSGDMKREHQQHPSVYTQKHADHQVKVKTLASVLKEQKATYISFLKIDVEGAEYEVLEGNDWHQFRPEVICIEANHIKKDWRPLLAKNGYELAFFDGLNEYYTDSKKPERRKRFSYEAAIVNKEPIVSYLLLPELEELERTQLRLAECEKEIDIKNQYIGHLEGQLGEVTPFRRHVKRMAKFKLGGINRRIVNALKTRKIYTSAPIAEATDLLKAAQEVDAANFARYNETVRETVALKAYLKARGVAARAVISLLRMRRV